MINVLTSIGCSSPQAQRFCANWAAYSAAAMSCMDVPGGWNIKPPAASSCTRGILWSPRPLRSSLPPNNFICCCCWWGCCCCCCCWWWCCCCCCCSCDCGVAGSGGVSRKLGCDCCCCCCCCCWCDKSGGKGWWKPPPNGVCRLGWWCCCCCGGCCCCWKDCCRWWCCWWGWWWGDNVGGATVDMEIVGVGNSSILTAFT